MQASHVPSSAQSGAAGVGASMARSITSSSVPPRLKTGGRDGRCRVDEKRGRLPTAQSTMISRAAAVVVVGAGAEPILIALDPVGKAVGTEPLGVDVRAVDAQPDGACERVRGGSPQSSQGSVVGASLIPIGRAGDS